MTEANLNPEQIIPIISLTSLSMIKITCTCIMRFEYS